MFRPNQLLALILAWLAACGWASAAPLTRVGEIQSLSPEQVLASPEVKVTGVVTTFEPAWNERFYLQDETGGILVLMSGPQEIHVGDLLEVTGKVDRGVFDPAIFLSQIRKLGTRKLPEPVPVGVDELMVGGHSGERVEIEGWVRFARFSRPNLLEMDLSTHGLRISLRVSNAEGMVPQESIAAKVRIAGVASAIQMGASNPNLEEIQLMVASPADITFIQHETVDPWQRPVVSLNQVLRYDPDASPGRRQHVAGVVTGSRGNDIYLHDGQAGLVVRTAVPITVETGARVEAVGFPELDQSLPVLMDAELRQLDRAAESIAATPVHPGDLKVRERHGDFVSLVGKLVDKVWEPKQGGGKLELVLQADGAVFTASMLSPLSREVADGIETGSQLEIKGTCLLETSPHGIPNGFRLAVSSPAMIRVVRPAPWWTAKRLLGALSLTLGLLLAGAFVMFRISRRNLRLRAELHEKNAITGERERLARDLHDSLAQGLTAIDLHLERVSRPATDEPPHGSLGSARSILEQCHHELRHTIWDLRFAPGRLDLPAALRRTGDQLTSGAGIDFHYASEGPPREIAPHLGENLIRIGQEAITNAVRHSHAKRIEVTVRFFAASLTLTVRDDGTGIPTKPLSPGERHFGLVGMRERTERIGASLEIRNLSDGGTLVEVTAPL